MKKRKGHDGMCWIAQRATRKKCVCRCRGRLHGGYWG